MGERGSGGGWRFSGLDSAPRRARAKRAARPGGARRPSQLTALFETLSTLMTVRDPVGPEHEQRVATVALLIADELAREWHLGERAAAAIGRYAGMHDIGTQGVPESVLLKPGPLNEEETLVARAHVRIGIALVDELQRKLGPSALPDYGVLRAVIAHHHERFDGSGYPDGLVGTDIPIAARIVAVADSLDTAATARPYRSARHIDDALDELAGQAGTLYDPDCIGALLRRRVALHLVYGDIVAPAPLDAPAPALAADAPTFGTA